MVFAGSNSREPCSAVGKGNGTNVFGDEACVLDADGAREEEQFGDDLLADECASRGPGDLMLFGNRKSNDDKTGRR